MGGQIVNHAQPAGPAVGAVPLFGMWNVMFTMWNGAAIVIGALAVWCLPRWCRDLPWRRVLGLTAAAAVAWTLALGFVDGSDVLTYSVAEDYGSHIDLVDQAGPGGFLRDYTDHQSQFPTHLQAHPPGLVLSLWVAAQVGFAGGWFHVALELAAVAVAVIAVLTITRDVAGDHVARAAAPFVVLAPAAIWHTNADVIYAGMALGAVALVVRATMRRDDKLAIAGGTLFGGALLFTYGVALLAVALAVIAVGLRRLRPLVMAGVAGLAVVALPLLWGFSWFEGLRTTKEQYDLNLVRVRPYYYWVVGNLASAAFALGPATVAGLAWLRDRATWLVAGGGLATILMADLTGLSNAETERIWQPFLPLLLIGTASLRQPRRWLALQVTVAVVLQAVLRSPW